VPTGEKQLSVVPEVGAHSHAQTNQGHHLLDRPRVVRTDFSHLAHAFREHERRATRLGNDFLDGPKYVSGLPCPWKDKLNLVPEILSQVHQTADETNEDRAQLDRF
jgi:hypothetical protein